jgi:uncharacterized membrane protein YeaQ/YmgE (transglycosylase-associated protein family)
MAKQLHEQTLEELKANLGKSKKFFWGIVGFYIAYTIFQLFNVYRTKDYGHLRMLILAITILPLYVNLKKLKEEIAKRENSGEK